MSDYRLKEEGILSDLQYFRKNGTTKEYEKKLRDAVEAILEWIIANDPEAQNDES